MKKVVKKLKRQFNEAKSNPLAWLAAGLVVVLLLTGVGVLVFTGGGVGGGDDSAGLTEDEKKKQKAAVKRNKKRKVKPAPVVTGSGTLDVARSEGRLAVAQARGRIKTPAGVQVRVSAAPKQTVTVDWQLSCYKASGRTYDTKIDKGRYRTRPPDIRRLPLPMSGADECTTTVGAQLTTGGSNGRIKVAVIAG